MWELARLQAESAGLPAARAQAEAEIGDFWSLLGDPAAAYRCYSRASDLAPSEPRYWFNRATAACHVGELEAAEAAYDQVISLRADDAQAYLNRSELRVQTAAANHVAELERELARSPGDWRHKVPLLYALAKEYEDVGEYARSWQCLSAGARLRRRHLQYDPRIDRATVDWIRESFPAGSAAVAGETSGEPIFILGMPRTGSTLVDRILGSHHTVFSAGELPDFGAAVVAGVQRARGSATGRRELIVGSAQLDTAALGRDYLRRTRPRTGHTPHFTDKLPLNYLYIGLIARALPQARIVHVTRGPLASCYAMYKVLFDRGYPFSYDLNELGDYYMAYRRLMNHWHDTLPGRIIEVAYERLVADLPGEARSLFERLGLPWEAHCLAFNENPSPVTTASAAQVRRPLYTGAVAAWRQYAPELAPLAQRLREGGIAPER